MKLSLISGIAALAVTVAVSVGAHAEQTFTATQTQIDNYCTQRAAIDAPQVEPVTWQHIQAQAELAPVYYSHLANGMNIVDLIREISHDEDGLLVAHDKLRDEAALMAITMETRTEIFRNMSEQELVAYWEAEFSK